MGSTNNNIGYNRKGLDTCASEESKQVVKDTYRALKRKKKFFNFQLSFNPMQGIVVPSSITHRNDYVSELVREPMDINFCGLRLRVKNISETKRMLRIVPFLRNITLLDCMLSEVRRSNTPFRDKINRQYVIDSYTEQYFENYRKTSKTLPNPLMISWFIGIAITCVFYVFMLIMLYKFSPYIAIMMLLLHTSVFGAYSIYTSFNKL